MNVRELIEILGVGDLDAEVYVAANVEGTRGRPLATVEDARRRGGPRVCLLTHLAGKARRIEIDKPSIASDPSDGLPLAAWGNGWHTIEAADVLPAAPAANDRSLMPNAQGPTHG